MEETFSGCDMVVYTYKSVTLIQQIAKAVFVIYVSFVQMQNEHWDSNNEYVYNICTKYYKLLSFYVNPFPFIDCKK